MADETDEMKLENELQTLMESNDLLVKENDIFTAHLFRNKQYVLQREKDLGNIKENEAEGFAASLNIVGPGEHIDRLMTQAEKMELVQLEEMATSSDLISIQEHAQKDMQSLKEVLEEAQIRANEVKKNAYEFRRDIVIGVDNMQTGQVEAQKVIKHIEDKLKMKEATIEKLKKNNTSLKTQIQKIDMKLKQKSEHGDSLHHIDFHQLKIENSQYNQKIEERNKELLKLKMTTGRTVQVLNSGKRDLATLLSESARLKQELNERRDQIQRLETEHERVLKDVERSKKVQKQYTEQLKNMEMPQIVDYVKQKMDERSLKGVLQNWQRKVEIAEIAARRCNTKLKKMRELQRLRRHQIEHNAAELAEKAAHSATVAPEILVAQHQREGSIDLALETTSNLEDS